MTLCDLVVQGDDGKMYRLQVLKTSDRRALVKAAIAKLGDLWPKFDFQFEADTTRTITKIL